MRHLADSNPLVYHVKEAVKSTQRKVWLTINTMTCTEVSLQGRPISHGRVFFFVVVLKNFIQIFATLTFSLAQCRTTRTTTTDDDWLCKRKEEKNKTRRGKKRNKTKATILRCAWFRLPRLRSRLFGLVGKVILLSFFFF